MHYYIDGYNLLFRSSQSQEELANQRLKIIHYLNEAISYLGLSITLIFDAHHQLNELQVMHFQNLEIIFTATTVSADAHILELLQYGYYPLNQITVVTSDKRLARLVKACQAHTQTIELFLGWLTKRFRNQSKSRSSPSFILASLNKTPSSSPTLVTPVAQLSSKEGTLDYYLKNFENNLQVLEQEKIDKKREKRQLQSTKKREKLASLFPAPKKESSLTEMARWLKAFEKEF